MVGWHHAFLGLLVVQIYVSAAPSNTSIEDPTQAQDTEIVVPEEDAKEEPIEVNPEEPKLDSKPLLIEETKLDDNSSQNYRQKRFYNFYGYGVPPINPIVYPSYNKRDQSAETGVYGLENPLEQIQRRLQDIASFVRQPILPPQPPSHFPFFFPVIYIPQYGCDCNSANDNTTPLPEPETPQTPGPSPQTPLPGTNQTNPDPEERFPELEDNRQNGGLLSNETEPEYDEEEFSRPISFDPIPPNRPNMRPAPPVDHGSSQGSSSDTQQSTTTVIPSNPPPSRPNSSAQGNPSSVSQQRPSSPGSAQPSSFTPSIPRNEQPSTCDGAILSCCHQSQVTYDCFVVQGCPDPTSYGNPCDPEVILQVIEKFQKFYGVRNGK